MSIERLVHMANQVANFFATNAEAEAVENTADHLKAFWDPRMRRDIEAHLRDHGGAGLSHIALEAVKILAARDAAKKSA